MTNQFDFYDCVTNWRNNLVAVDEKEAENDLDWFFPGVDFSVKENLVDVMHRVRYPEPTMPSITIRGLRMPDLKEDSELINLGSLDSWEQLKNRVAGNWISFSIYDCDGCDFDFVQDIFDSEDVFDEIVDNYRRQL